MISTPPPPPPPHSSLCKVNMMLNVNRNPKAYSKNGEKGRGVLCGEEYICGGRIYIGGGKSIYILFPHHIYRYTVTTRMTPALDGQR